MTLLVRPLTQAEEVYLRVEDQLRQDARRHTVSSHFGPLSALVSPLSVMGKEIHLKVQHVKSAKQYWVDFGGGDGMWEGAGRPEAPSGESLLITWGEEGPYRFILEATKALGIPVFGTGIGSFDTLYFERRYERAFIDAFRYADRASLKWFENRTLFSKWFGAIYMERGCKEDRAIYEDVRSIFAKTK